MRYYVVTIYKTGPRGGMRRQANAPTSTSMLKAIEIACAESVVKGRIVTVTRHAPGPARGLPTRSLVGSARDGEFAHATPNPKETPMTKTTDTKKAAVAKKRAGSGWPSEPTTKGSLASRQEAYAAAFVAHRTTGAKYPTPAMWGLDKAQGSTARAQHAPALVDAAGRTLATVKDPKKAKAAMAASIKAGASTKVRVA